MNCRGLKSKQSRLVLLLCYVGLGLVLLVLLALIPPTNTVKLGSGGFVRVKSSSFLSSMVSETSCKIIYQPKEGETKSIIMLQDSDSEPAMIIPAADGKTFLCLYYADVRFRLLRIDPSKMPVAFPQGSYLKYIVLSSSCHIEPATDDDWRQVSHYLESVPQSVFNQQTIGFIGYRRRVLSSGVDRMMWNMQHGFY
jgi:hypothetical protein